MRVIFTAVLGGFMDHQFGQNLQRALLKLMVEGSIEVYLCISQELPTSHQQPLSLAPYCSRCACG